MTSSAILNLKSGIKRSVAQRGLDIPNPFGRVFDFLDEDDVVSPRQFGHESWQFFLVMGFSHRLRGSPRDFSNGPLVYSAGGQFSNRSLEDGCDLAPSQIERAQMIDCQAYRIYCASMSREQLTQEVMALPLAERVSLAQDLWQSIEEVHGSPACDDEAEALAVALRRDAELSSGAVTGRTHEQVMESMRQATECA